MILVCNGNPPLLYKANRVGKILREAKSPDAPNTTSVRAEVLSRGPSIPVYVYGVHMVSLLPLLVGGWCMYWWYKREIGVGSLIKTSRKAKRATTQTIRPWKGNMISTRRFRWLDCVPERNNEMWSKASNPLHQAACPALQLFFWTSRAL